MNLSKTLRTGALTGLMGLAACASSYETVDWCNSPPFVFTPGILEPGFCRDARAEVIARKAEDRARQSQSGITVATPEGYSVNLQKYSEVMYRGKNHMVWEVNPPYIDIAPYKDSQNIQLRGYQTRESFSIPIKELDMFKK